MARTSTKKETATAATENNSATTDKKVFLLTDVGTYSKGTYAFHVEGFLTRDPALLTAQEGKDAMVTTSIGIGMGAKALMAKAKREDAPEGEDSDFVNLVFKGKLAEKFAAEAKKGNKVAVTGGLSQKQRTDKDGNPREEVTIWVDNYVVLPKDGGTRNKRITSIVHIYNDKEGKSQSENMVTLLTGKIVNLQPLTTSPSGTNYLKFGLALAVPGQKVFDLATTGKVGTYPEDANSFMNVTFFGKSAETKAKFLKNGMVVAITGRIKDDEYEGKVSYSMFPNDVSIVAWPKDNEEAAGPEGMAAAPGYGGNYPDANDFAELDDDDTELPF